MGHFQLYTVSMDYSLEQLETTASCTFKPSQDIFKFFKNSNTDLSALSILKCIFGSGNMLRNNLFQNMLVS